MNPSMGVLILQWDIYPIHEPQSIAFVSMKSLPPVSGLCDPMDCETVRWEHSVTSRGFFPPWEGQGQPQPRAQTLKPSYIYLHYMPMVTSAISGTSLVEVEGK